MKTITMTELRKSMKGKANPKHLKVIIEDIGPGVSIKNTVWFMRCQEQKGGTRNERLFSAGFIIN